MSTARGATTATTSSISSRATSNDCKTAIRCSATRSKCFCSMGKLAWASFIGRPLYFSGPPSAWPKNCFDLALSHCRLVSAKKERKLPVRQYAFVECIDQDGNCRAPPSRSYNEDGSLCFLAGALALGLVSWITGVSSGSDHESGYIVENPERAKCHTQIAMQVRASGSDGRSRSGQRWLPRWLQGPPPSAFPART